MRGSVTRTENWYLLSSDRLKNGLEVVRGAVFAWVELRPKTESVGAGGWSRVSVTVATPLFDNFLRAKRNEVEPETACRCSRTHKWFRRYMQATYYCVIAQSYQLAAGLPHYSCRTFGRDGAYKVYRRHVCFVMLEYLQGFGQTLLSHYSFALLDLARQTANMKAQIEMAQVAMI